MVGVKSEYTTILTRIRLPPDSCTKILFLTGVFIVCMCSLMLQIMETRLLSVIAWYYMAFFAISMAMFGMTVQRRISAAGAGPSPEPAACAECVERPLELSQRLKWIWVQYCHGSYLRLRAPALLGNRRRPRIATTHDAGAQRRAATDGLGSEAGKDSRPAAACYRPLVFAGPICGRPLVTGAVTFVAGSRPGRKRQRAGGRWERDLIDGHRHVLQ